MIDYLKLFQTGTAASSSMVTVVGSSETAPVEEPVQAGPGSVSIDDLDLSVRSNNCLRRAASILLMNWFKRPEEDMMKVRNLDRNPSMRLRKNQPIWDWLYAIVTKNKKGVGNEWHTENWAVIPATVKLCFAHFELLHQTREN